LLSFLDQESVIDQRCDDFFCDERFSYSESSAFESSQYNEQVTFHRRRRNLNDIIGDPRDPEFRAQLLIRCKTNDWPNLQIRHDLFLRGSGVYATDPIRQNAFVCDYAGIWISNFQYDALMKDADEVKRKQIQEYVVGGRKSTILAHDEIVEKNPRLKNSFGRLINHSAVHPNLKAPQFFNLAPTGEPEDWHALMQVCIFSNKLILFY
jgi:hypothetical protein